MRPFRIYPASFDGNTLGYWRFGERGGQLDSVVAGGPAFVNHGATAVEDGYQFIRTDGDYMDADWATGQAVTNLTLECWIRQWQTPTDQYGLIATFYDPVSLSAVYLVARRTTNPAGSGIYFSQRIGGVWRGAWQWIGAAADNLLASGNLIHIAGVMTNGHERYLYINGVLRGVSSGDFFLGFTGSRVRLGRQWADATWDLSAVLDEVRLSNVARYTANFPVTRFGEGRRLGLRGPGSLATAGAMP
jgi:hypothetical protein